jgi:hypothetical protein
MRFQHTYTCILVSLALAVPCVAQQNDNDVDGLKRQIAAQQKQIDELRQSLDAEQKQLEQLTPSAPLVASTSTAAVSGALNQQMPLQQAPISAKDLVSPLSFRIGQAEFTPLGFMDLTSVWRSTDVGSGIGTSFNGIPFNNAAAGVVPENRFSAQNSRIGLKVTTDYKGTPVTGYLEADFLGNAPATLNVTSNANTLRMRLYWVDIRPGKWEILGGQSWSMMTPNRVGISPMPADIFYSQNMDTNYQLGLVWTRAPQFRVVYHASGATDNGFHIGFAIENPEQYTSSATLPSFVGSQVDASGNTATPNLSPDIQAKIAYDVKSSSHAFHIEAAGLVSNFSVAGPAPALTTSSLTAAGGEVNFNFEVLKGFRLIGNSFYSSGEGRYIQGNGPDFIVRNNGSLSPVHSGSGVAGFEYQAKKELFFAYYGTAYFGRNFDEYAAGKYYGFGYPGSATSNNREIQEYTFGYVHTFWKSANHGAIQLINQYSYLTRAPWYLAAGAPVNAHVNMIFNDLRYTLP